MRIKVSEPPTSRHYHPQNILFCELFVGVCIVKSGEDQNHLILSSGPYERLHQASQQSMK